MLLSPLSHNLLRTYLPSPLDTLPPPRAIKEGGVDDLRIAQNFISSYPFTLMPQLTQSQGVRGTEGSRSTFSFARAVYRVASDLVRRVQFGARAGFRSFQGHRDLYQALGYLETITLADYKERYARGGIAGRVVNWLPEEVWGSGPISVIETTKPSQESAFEKDVAYLFKKLSIQSRLEKADKLAARAQYSVILIGTSDPNLSAPITRLSGGTRSIIYLMQIPQERARILEWVGQSGLAQDKSDPRYGLPKYYEVKIGTVTSSSLGEIVDTDSNVGLKVEKVHHTRILHVAHTPLEDDIYAEPRLKVIWNDLDDFYKVKGGGAEAQWMQQSLPTLFNLKSSDDSGATIEFSEDEEKALKEEIDHLMTKVSPYALTENVEANPLAGKGLGRIDFAANGEFLLKVIAGGSKIPYEAFVGNEVGLRGSEQNAKAIQYRVDEYVNEHAEPLLRDLIDRFILWGVVSKPSTGEYDCVWPEEAELDSKGKADLMDKYASINEKMYKAGERTPITPDEIREVAGFDPLPELPEEEIVQPVVVVDPTLVTPSIPVPQKTNGTEVIQ